MSEIRFNRWSHQSGTGGIYQDSSGNIGIGTSTPTSVLDIQGGSIKIGNDLLTSSGVSTFTSGLNVTGGSVGIGTDNPNANSQLHIESSSYQPIYVNTSYASGGGAAFLYSNTQTLYLGTGGSTWLTGSSTADGLIRSESNLIFASGGNTERLRITSSGNIGIGTDTPGAKLDLGGSSSGQTLLFSNTGSNSGSRVTSTISFKTATLYTGKIIESNITGAADDVYDMRFFTANGTASQERLRIDSGGKIGIGITNPSGKLTVYDNSQNFNDGQNLIRLEYPGGYSQGDTGGGIVFSQHWFSGDTARARTGGIYGVKTGQSGIYGGGLAIYTQPHSGDPMQELVRLSGRQRIGIGHTDPLSKVEIQGSGDGGSGVTGLSDLTTKSSLLIKELSGSNTSLIAGVRSTGGQFIQGAYRADPTVSVRDISINPYGGSVSLGGVASNFGGAPDSGGSDVKIYTTPNTSGADPVVRAYVQPNGGISYYTGSTGYDHATYGSYNGFGMARWTEGYSNVVAYSQFSTGGTFWHESITRGISTFSNVGLISFQGSGNCGFVVTVEYWMVSAVNANRQYGKLSAHAWRTSNNNFNISTENDISRDYFGNGGTSAYINLSWGSSGSGSSQVLTLRVSSDAVFSAGAYTRTLFRTTYSAMDYANVVTVLR